MPLLFLEPPSPVSGSHVRLQITRWKIENVKDDKASRSISEPFFCLNITNTLSVRIRLYLVK